MILINALAIRDSGGINVLKKVLDECSLDKSIKFLIICGNNKNLINLSNFYKEISHFNFKFYECNSLLRRFYIENIIFRGLEKKYKIKLLYQFTGSAQLFTKIPQLSKLHDISFFSRDVQRQYFVQKIFFNWLKHNFLKRLIFSSMIKRCEFLEVQSDHVSTYIDDYINISKKRLFIKSDININKEEFRVPVLMDPKTKITLIYVVGPHFNAVHKNIETFIKAASKLKEEGFDFEIAITLTKQELYQSGVWDASLDSRTKFLGYIRKDELIKLFTDNSVLISTSIIETLGLHVIEAIQNGTLAIVPKEKYSSAVYGSSILTYETLNPDSLVDAIKNVNTRSEQELNSITLESQEYLISNEGLKIESVLEIFKSILMEDKKIRKTCTNCVMDTSDIKIIFDDNGKCDHCINFETNILPNWNNGNDGHVELQKIASKIKREGINKEFDCIIGLSGGLDSSYTAHIAKEVMGLRPLLFHVDAGWNTDQAVGNIEKLVDGLNSDLYTEVINWKEMQDLQVAFLKSQIPDQDIPQDTAFFSALYKFAMKNKIKYVLTGGNFSTECCREPDAWGAFPGIDKTLIHDIHKKFGSRELKTFPVIDALVYKIYHHRILRMKVFKPLDFVPYIKADAEALLGKKYGWKPFQHKHHESRFTRFYEDYWMPRKFGYEKRRAHFSSLIMTNQMTRDEALERLKIPELNDKFVESEFEYVADKLDLTPGQLRDIFNGNNKSFHDYKNKYRIFSLGGKILNLLGLERRQYR